MCDVQRAEVGEINTFPMGFSLCGNIRVISCGVGSGSPVTDVSPGRGSAETGTMTALNGSFCSLHTKLQDKGGRPIFEFQI